VSWSGDTDTVVFMTVSVDDMEVLPAASDCDFWNQPVQSQYATREKLSAACSSTGRWTRGFVPLPYDRFALIEPSNGSHW